MPIPTSSILKQAKAEYGKLHSRRAGPPVGGERVLYFPAWINSAAMNFLARQQKLREHLATTRFDALLISHLPNIRYLCGFTGSAGLLLVQKKPWSVFFTDVRYDRQAHEEVKAAKVVIAPKSVLAALGEFLSGRRKDAGMGHRDRGGALYDCGKRSA